MNASVTSSVTAPEPSYARASSARGRSTRRTHRPSPTSRPEPLGVGELEEQRMRDGRPPGLDAADEVDAGDPFPEGALGGGVEAGDLEDIHLVASGRARPIRASGGRSRSRAERHRPRARSGTWFRTGPAGRHRPAARRAIARRSGRPPPLGRASVGRRSAGKIASASSRSTIRTRPNGSAGIRNRKSLRAMSNEPWSVARPNPKRG